MSYEQYKDHRLVPDDNGCWSVLNSEYEQQDTYPSKAAAKRAIDEILASQPTNESQDKVELEAIARKANWEQAKVVYADELASLIAEERPSTDQVTRFEVIDHRQCVWCRGRLTANYAQEDGSYKELPCDKCDGSGISGGRVYVAQSNAETSNIQIELSYQDDGKTLRVFVNDKETL